MKLVSKAESDELREKLLKGYDRIFKLGDEILAFILKGHEDVRIWQLNPDELEAIVDYKLEAARQSKSAAREVRFVVDSLGRIEYYAIISVRVYRSGNLIFQKGLSIR